MLQVYSVVQIDALSVDSSGGAPWSACTDSCCPENTDWKCKQDCSWLARQVGPGVSRTGLDRSLPSALPSVSVFDRNLFCVQIHVVNMLKI